MLLTNFDKPVLAVVVGASGGIGRAFVDRLAASDAIERVVACTRRPAPSDHSKIVNEIIDIEDESTIEAAAQAVRGHGQPGLVIVASGILHGDGLEPEKTWRQIDPVAMQQVFAINTTGPALVAKHFLPLLPRDARAVFAALSARVGSISDNRLGGWVSYRASKAALNMVIRTLSIELRRRNPGAIIAGLHPGTVDTALSAPFQANVPDGKLFTTADAAAKLLRVIDDLDSDASGRVFAWDGSVVPA